MTFTFCLYIIDRTTQGNIHIQAVKQHEQIRLHIAILLKVQNMHTR